MVQLEKSQIISLKGLSMLWSIMFMIIYLGTNINGNFFQEG